MSETQGPTTVGSIEGKLKLDASSWMETIALAETRARELARTDPTIKVDVKSDKALAELAAVEAAQAKLGRDWAESNVKVTALTDQLINAEKRLVAVELALAAAQENRSESTERANQSMDRGNSRVQMIIAAVAVLIPMISALGAYTAAVAGGLTMMGAAGILAIVGIRREMQTGTDAGKSFSSGIDTLKGSLDRLAGTAAAEMLGQYERAVRIITGATPELNTQVALLSRQLGVAGNTTLAAVINGLRVLNPMIVTGAAYVERLAQGLLAWTQNGGAQRFSDYAIGVFPRVADTLGRVAEAVVHIVEATAPLGTVTLGILSTVADVINALPAEVLVNVAGAATAGFLAFKAWGLIAPILAVVAEAVAGVGAATTIAAGPVGLIAAAVAALAAVFVIAAASTQDATTAQENYTAAVQQDNGVIAAHTAAQAAKNLQDQGALDMAKRLGLSVQTVTDAALGNKAAMAEVSRVTDRATGAWEKYKDAGFVVGAENKKRSAEAQLLALDAEGLTKVIGDQNSAIQVSIDQYGELSYATGATTAQTEAQTAAVKKLAAGYGMTLEQYIAATNSQKSTADQLKATTDAMFIQNNAAGLLKGALDTLNGVAISAAQAQNQFDSQLANMGAHIAKNGDEVDRATASLEGNSAAAVANRGELISSTTAAFANAESLREQGKGQGEVRQSLIDMKQAIIDHAVEVGEDRDQVQAFIDKIFEIPAEVPPTKLEVDAANALAKLQAVKDAVNALPKSVGLSVTSSGGLVFSDSRNSRNDSKGHADGGTIGGPGNAFTDTAGLFRLSKGEEVISNKFGQADKFRPLLKAINSGTVESLGDRRPAAPTTVVNNVTHQWTINQVDNPVSTANAVANRFQLLGV